MELLLQLLTTNKQTNKQTAVVLPRKQSEGEGPKKEWLTHMRVEIINSSQEEKDDSEKSMEGWLVVEYLEKEEKEEKEEEEEEEEEEEQEEGKEERGK